MKKSILPLTLCVLTGVAACGGGSSATKTVTMTQTAPASSAAQTPSSTEATSPTSTETSSSTESPSSQASSETTTDAATPDDGSSSDGPKILSPKGEDKTLSLQDAFYYGNWETGSFTPVGTSTAVSAAIESPEISCYSSLTDDLLEYRFGGATGTLHFDFAQDSQSRSSANKLEFDLIVNNKTTQTKVIDYSGHDTLSVPLAGVNAVQLLVKDVTGSDCQGSANALVTKVYITAK